jgi:probable F420-dependent oxidoreductase
MKFGVAIFPTDYSISMTELAPAAEQLGFESLWVAEHSHIPTSRLSAWPGGQELPKQYSHTLDPFVALTVAALASKTLRIATGICLVVQRDPIHTAKQVASLDQISNGRFLFGVGAGWNREEMADHGTDFSTRFQLLRERVEAMKAIWTQEAAEYHGQLVNFDPTW